MCVLAATIFMSHHHYSSLLLPTHTNPIFVHTLHSPDEQRLKGSVTIILILLGSAQFSSRHIHVSQQRLLGESTNLVSLGHDAERVRVHAVLICQPWREEEKERERERGRKRE